MDMNQLQTEITNTEITKNELQRQLDILTKQYETETKELERLNCKNIEYKNAYSKQENAKKVQNETEKRKQGQQNLSELINQLGQNMRR